MRSGRGADAAQLRLPAACALQLQERHSWLARLLGTAVGCSRAVRRCSARPSLVSRLAAAFRRGPEPPGRDGTPAHPHAEWAGPVACLATPAWAGARSDGWVSGGPPRSGVASVEHRHPDRSPSRGADHERFALPCRMASVRASVLRADKHWSIRLRPTRRAPRMCPLPPCQGCAPGPP